MPYRIFAVGLSVGQVASGLDGFLNNSRNALSRRNKENSFFFSPYYRYYLSHNGFRLGVMASELDNFSFNSRV